ncbi:hypothetical protein HQQ81_19080 [Microbacteriaceae bacterium VKM Ac-2854]|nr:hypothetical protein [Microbacteriaceae bacterium VKM Ac-2854]
MPCWRRSTPSISVSAAYGWCRAPTSSARASIRRYWRGPSWFNTAWLIAQGLLAAGRTADATALSAQTTAAAADGDYPEYVDPHTGAPKGTRRFSWTAALTLDLERTL